MSTAEDARGEVAGTDRCSYADFGRDFLRRAVTVERVTGALATIAGRAIEFGPRRAGPGGMATVTAHGVVGTPEVAALSEVEPLRFGVRVPVDLRLAIMLGALPHRFSGQLSVPATLTAYTAPGVRIVIDIAPPEPEDVTVSLNAQGAHARLLGRLADMETELRRVVARQVTKEIDGPELHQARDIDIGAIVDRSGQGERDGQGDRSEQGDRGRRDRSGHGDRS